MDIYKNTEKAVSGQKLKPNRGVVVATRNAAGTAQTAVDWITYGPDGTTYSTRIQLPTSLGGTYLIPIRTWGLSFSSADNTAFGVS